MATFTEEDFKKQLFLGQRKILCVQWAKISSHSWCWCAQTHNSSSTSIYYNYYNFTGQHSLQSRVAKPQQSTKVAGSGQTLNFSWHWPCLETKDTHPLSWQLVPNTSSLQNVTEWPTRGAFLHTNDHSEELVKRATPELGCAPKPAISHFEHPPANSRWALVHQHLQHVLIQTNSSSINITAAPFWNPMPFILRMGCSKRPFCASCQKEAIP